MFCIALREELLSSSSNADGDPQRNAESHVRMSSATLRLTILGRVIWIYNVSPRVVRASGTSFELQSRFMCDILLDGNLGTAFNQDWRMKESEHKSRLRCAFVRLHVSVGILCVCVCWYSDALSPFYKWIYNPGERRVRNIARTKFRGQYFHITFLPSSYTLPGRCGVVVVVSDVVLMADECTGEM